MNDRIKHIMTQLYVEQHIDLLDVASVKRYALENQLYDVVVYINNNLTEYLAFAKSICV